MVQKRSREALGDLELEKIQRGKYRKGTFAKHRKAAGTSKVKALVKRLGL